MSDNEKIVALVGHCGPDSSYLRMAVSGAAPGARVIMVDSNKELDQALKEDLDLLMFNRVLEIGFDESDGIALMGKVKQKKPDQVVMMISNYPEAQEAAEKLGAVPGFGKREVGSDKSRQRIRAALGIDAPTD